MLPLDLDQLARGVQGHASVRVTGDDVRRAAVALVFSPTFDLLFIRRSVRPGDPWSGHMALPGGRMDPRDTNLRATAARETREEVGIDLEQARFLGPLDELPSPVHLGRRRVVISPFVYALDAVPTLQPNHEVAEVHWLGLRRLLLGEGRSTFNLPWRGREVPLPVVRLGTADIWGITLRIVDDLVRRLQELERGNPEAFWRDDDEPDDD